MLPQDDNVCLLAFALTSLATTLHLRKTKRKRIIANRAILRRASSGRNDFEKLNVCGDFSQTNHDALQPTDTVVNKSGDKQKVQEQRLKHFMKAISISYANSGGLMIMRGKGSKLIDETGRSYLDTRNNVCHVGHCHPRVVEAVSRQLATLNTNTRYLHPNVSELAERLCAKCPQSLEVVVFVNSGSVRFALSTTNLKSLV